MFRSLAQMSFKKSELIPRWTVRQMYSHGKMTPTFYTTQPKSQPAARIPEQNEFNTLETASGDLDDAKEFVREMTRWLKNGGWL